MEKLSHAYIVSSASEEEGLKQAVTLASKMLCSGMGKKPCGVCRDCRKIKAGVHPDLGFVRRSLDDKGNKKRDIQERGKRQGVYHRGSGNNERERPKRCSQAV